MDSGDDRSSTPGVGPDWPLIPGPTSALFDIDAQFGVNGEKGGRSPFAVREIPFSPGITHPDRTGSSHIPVPPSLGRTTIIESTFEVGRRFRCTMRVDCDQLESGALIGPEPGEWHRACPSALTKKSWRTGAPAATRSISSRP
jgi:hypothetical protein